MSKSLSVVRLFMFAVLLSFLALFQADQLETFAQSTTQDLGFSGVTQFPQSPRPDGFVSITVMIANNGTIQSQGFNITTEFEQIGVGSIELGPSQLLNPCLISGACNTGIPGRQPIFNNSGQQIGLADPSENQVGFTLNTAGFAEGLYRLTINLDPSRLANGDSTGVINDPVGADHTVEILLPIFTSPEFSPASLTFFPGSPVPLNSQVTVSSTIHNTGQTDPSGNVAVQFFYCQQSVSEAACQPSNSTAFGSTATRALSMFLGNTTDTNNDGSDDNFKQSSSSQLQSGITASASLQATLDTSQLSPGLYRIGVRVNFASASPDVAEADTNNNEITALLTVGGAVGGGGVDVRQFLEVQNQSGGSTDPVFVSPSTNQLTVFDRKELEALVRCGGLLLAVNECPDDLEVVSSSFVSAFEGIEIDQGTVRLDVLNDAFKAFDATNTAREIILADWQFEANITAIAQNPIQPIVYIGLSDGVLIRLNLKEVLPEDLSEFTAAELVANFGILVRSDSEITALFPLTNGVVIGVTHEDGDGQVHFLLDSFRSPSRIASPREMGRVHKFQATPGFLYTVSDDIGGGAPRLFITRILTSSIAAFSVSTALTGLSGEYADFVVNRSSRMFIATNRGDVGTVYSYRLSPTQNSSSPLFSPWESFIDPADDETVYNLSSVQTLALGDVTESNSTDEVLYIGTNERLYTVEIQRQFSSRQDLLWVINIGGNVSAFEAASLGTTFSGLMLVASSDSTFNYVDGRNRSASDQLPNEIVNIGSAIKSTIFSEDNPVADGFIFLPRIVNLYASDAIYFTAILN